MTHDKSSTEEYGLFDQNITNHSNSSIRFNSLDEAAITHEFIPQNILKVILPSNIHLKANGVKNIAMPILEKSCRRETI